MSSKVSVYTPYGEAYMTQCKTLWYSSGRPHDATKIRRLLEEQNCRDEYGRVPSVELIKDWKDKYGWEAWADILDAESNALVEVDLINQRAEMLKEQANAGKELWKMGLQYLKSEDGGFDSSSAAVQAVIRGTELERTARGIGEVLEKLSKMSNADLQAEIVRQLTRASAAGQVIDTEEIPQDKKDDTESI